MKKKFIYSFVIIGLLILSIIFINNNESSNISFLNSINNVTINKNSKISYDITNINSSLTTFNRYTIKYTSNVYIRGEITYKINGVEEKERFFLEPATNYTFSSFINGYIDNRYVNKKDLVSINFENISASSGKFTLISFELVSYPVINDLISSINGSLNDNNYTNQKTVFMSSNNLKLGLSLNYGGSINYISGNSNIFSTTYTNKNLINRYDNGRLIQQCIYGNQIYSRNNTRYISGAEDNIDGLYNPIQGGNINYKSKIVDIGVSSDKKTITIKTKPTLWRVNNSQYIKDYYDYYQGYTTDSYMLTTYTIHDTYIDVKNSFIDFTDNVNNTNNGYARSESPSVYTISSLNKFYIYDMSSKKIKNISIGSLKNGFKNLNPNSDNNGQAMYSYWGGYFATNSNVTEGIGIYHPGYDGVNQYMMGFVAGNTTSDSSLDNTTSFFSSIIHLNNGRLKQFKTFSYDYVITLGNISNINNIMNTYRNDHSYTLKVNPNGGSFNNSTSTTTLSPKLLAYWGNWNNIGSATRNGYKLLGYYTAKSGGIKVYDASGLAVNSAYWKVNTTSTLTEEKYQYIGNKDLTVYARWEANKYSISYNLDGGTATNPTSYTIENNITLNKPTKKGYKFVGWIGTDLKNPTMNVTIPKGTVGNRTYTAVWELADYTITFNPNGGNTNQSTKTIQYGNQIGILPNPTKKGYLFLGWYDKKDSGNKIVATDKYNYEKNITLYAHWQLEKYTISYSLDGGTSTNPTSYTVESNDIILNNPVKKGYTFVGWIGTDISEAKIKVTIFKGSTGNKIYKAIWKATNYTITYDACGGELSQTTQNVSYGNQIGDMPVPTKKNNNFLGWYTDKENGKRILTTSIYDYNQNITLYARWTTSEVYTINFAKNNLTTEIPSEKRVVGDKYGPLPIPEKKGYKFIGWYTSNKDGQKIDENMKIQSNITLYSRWEIINYNIKYNLNGGKAKDNPTSYNIETNTFTLNNPIKENHIFKGWQNDSDGNISLKVTINKGTIGNKTYTAIFTKEEASPEQKDESDNNDDKKVEEEKKLNTNTSQKENNYLWIPIVILIIIITLIIIYKKQKKNKSKKDILS